MKLECQVRVKNSCIFSSLIFSHAEKTKTDGYPVWTFEAKLYYKESNSTGTGWSLLAESTEKRNLVCHFEV